MNIIIAPLPFSGIMVVMLVCLLKFESLSDHQSEKLQF
ncbi:hypothetical protein FVO58_01315 [Metabacillus halosaccharovorans]|nr:hypothetical protein [Metabacillus halosaccharovorans]